MAFNIEGFKSRVNAYNGFQKTTHYKVFLTPPYSLTNRIAQFRDFEFFAEQAILPGVTLTAHDLRRHGYGVSERRPYGAAFTDASITFVHDNSGMIYRTMNTWINYIFNHDMRNGVNAAGVTNNQFAPYLVAYKSDYVTDLNIWVYNGAGGIQADPFDPFSEQLPVQPTYVVVLREAYPIAMSDTNMNWSDQNNYARLTVQFAYQDFFIGEYEAQ